MALLLNACMIFPHRATFTPAIVGRVHRSGTPVENAMVSVVNGSPCNKGTAFVRTDSQGKFSAQRTTKMRYVLTMDTYYSFAVCIADRDRQYSAWVENGLGYSPGYMTLDCDLENNQLNYNKRRGSGVCRDITQYNTKGKKP